MFTSVESQIYSMFIISITILAVLNPFGNLTQFIAMTAELAKSIRQKLFRNILYTAFIIVMVFLFSGPFIMRYVFNVSLDDLRIAGGLILIIMATKNLLFTAKKQDFLHYQGLDEKDLLRASVVPMAFPMLVGPGTLSTAIIASEDQGLLVACGAIVLAFAFMFLLFHFAATIERIIGKLILHVFSRIAQVFIMAIGIKMIIVGIKDIFHL
ncbi:MarC family protein [Campylobacter sp. MIT 97-5078]|uniref:MarC family protein n=1 Tax=Campylobacter sp. MIT 97-5078 TaxID=1548153 RepID=UPI000512DB39|nr:MarC family protein [Campylobacter sp. MIT 97-5078]KGI55222.1 membrane protein [Campylobacter sp. MIT 97-5078]KGI56892.1 membrane protein [Campylobacter sp. MIT 97-5078]KGI56897.1 membrane protein [Campylobacter sp. MIT 97-5078]TQR26730.1 MarC family protein [Campylobacter sp. MIT 97-5078]